MASSPPRSVKAVQLSLQSTLLTPAKSAAAAASAPEKLQSTASDTPLSLESLSVPHNDFFTAQFLVTFPTAGSYQVRMD